MFEGYEDPVLQMYSTFENEEEEEQEDFWMEEKSTPAPAKIPMDKFGWFYKVGAFRNLRVGWWFCRGTGHRGPTGIYGCTQGRETWSVWVRLSPGTRTTKLRRLKASGADNGQDTHVGREIVNEPWSFGNFSSLSQRDSSPNWQPFCCNLDLARKQVSQSKPNFTILTNEARQCTQCRKLGQYSTGVY